MRLQRRRIHMQYSLSEKQLEAMRSALGWHRVTDLNKVGWRNYFSAGYSDPDLNALVEQGLMVGNSEYSVTKAGARLLGVPEARIKSLGKELPNGIVPKPKPDTSSRLKASNKRGLISGMARSKNALVLQFMFSRYKTELDALQGGKVNYAQIYAKLRGDLKMARLTKRRLIIDCRRPSEKNQAAV